jgi:hypothetical protein
MHTQEYRMFEQVHDFLDRKTFENIKGIKNVETGDRIYLIMQGRIRVVNNQATKLRLVSSPSPI